MGILSRLVRDRRAAAIPMLAIGMVPALAAIGGGIDYGRIYLVKSRLQTGVDAAALAGARAYPITEPGPKERGSQVDAYFGENFEAGFMGSYDLKLEKEFSTVRDINISTITASVKLPMSIMQIFNIPPAAIRVKASAELQPQPLEVMMALDNTGSMNDALDAGRTRLQALKQSATSFIDILHQGQRRRPDVAVGMLNYTITTNVGKILQDHGVAIQAADGFRNVGEYTGGSSSFPENPLAWKGCVDNDLTIPDVDKNYGFSEPGAWDLTKSLPGEGAHPAVAPYHYRPSTPPPAMYQTNGTTGYVAADYFTKDYNTNTKSNRQNNAYRLAASGDNVTANKLANSPIYREAFYDMYIGLNSSPADPSDDVVVDASTGGYWAPGGTQPWRIEYARIPWLNLTNIWSAPNPRYGAPFSFTVPRDGYTLAMPSPNWQCTEPALELKYGRDRGDYDRFISDSVFSIEPGNGTNHHIGLLWAYRLLARSDVFTRENPTANKPKRALIFMTDGVGYVPPNIYSETAYGRYPEKKLSSLGTPDDMETQLMRRFAKVCENVKRDGIEMYVVVLASGANDIFKRCAGTRYYIAKDTDSVNRAFQEIAMDLIDLHLVS